MLTQLVQTYLLEPANYIVDNPSNITMHNIYISNEYPTEIHPYNIGFERKDPQIMINPLIEDCLDLNVCVGVGDGTHPYFKAEGIQFCHTCKKMCVVYVH
jgi:hypothetical protein